MTFAYPDNEEDKLPLGTIAELYPVPLSRQIEILQSRLAVWEPVWRKLTQGHGAWGKETGDMRQYRRDVWDVVQMLREQLKQDRRKLRDREDAAT